MAKKYVPAGVFLTCDKGTLPTTLNVVFNARTVFHGQNVATDLDVIPQTNIPSMGVCSISKGPCLLVPAGKWSPVKDDVQLGGGHPLLEDSQLRCGLTGCISIHFSLAEAQAACPPPPAPKASVLDQLDERMKGWGPLGAYGRFQLGVGEGLWAGGKGLAEGLWGVAKGGWNAAMHPIDTAHAIGEGASNAYQWAGDSQNWSNAAHSAGQGISDAASWAGNGDNWHHVGEQLGSMSPRDWGKVTGRVGFEVGLTVATAGAGTALVAAAETSRLARAALLVARVADVEGLALSAAGKLARTAAGQMRILGKFVTGAKQGRRVAQAAREARAALRASPLGRKLKGVAAWVERKRKCLRDPVDVADGVMLFGQVDLELSGPIPFTWERKWYSNSEYAGPLGHGWHHAYDSALLADAEEVAVRLGDGRLVLFARPTADTAYRVFNRLERLELTLDSEGNYRVFSLDERRHYCFAPLATDLDTYRLHRIEDANGFAIALTYDAQGQLRTLTDSAGRQVRLQLDAHGRVTALEVPEPIGTGYFTAARYQYDEAGNLVAVVDALGYAVRYAYQGHLLVQKTLTTGSSFYFEYDGFGPAARCVHTWGDGNLLNGRFHYEPGRTTVTSTTPGDVHVYEHADGLVTRHTDPLGATCEWRYDPYGDLRSERDPLNRITSYEYDARGNQTRRKSAGGSSVQTIYNEQDIPIELIEATGSVWQWTHDAAGNMLTCTEPTDTRTTYAYDASGRLIRAVDGAGQATYLHYDGQHNLTRLVAPDGSSQVRTYDALGRVIKLADALGNTEYRSYDHRGHLLRLQKPDGSTLHLHYDGRGQLVRATEGQQLVEFAYNGLGQLAERSQAGQQIQFTYDAQGQLTALTNERGEVYRFILDTAGRVIEEMGFDGLSRCYEYDPAGQVVRVIRPAGRTTAYTYDAEGQIVEILHNGTERSTYRFGPDGALLEATNEAATVLVERDARGHVVREVQQGVTVNSTYDQLGQRLALRSSLGADLTITRNALGDAIQLQSGSWFSHLGRDARGLEMQRTHSNGVHTSWQRDALGRPTSQHLVVKSRAGKADEQRTRRHEWQGLTQLLATSDTELGETRYRYDAVGNLLASQHSDGSPEIRQPDVDSLFQTAPLAARSAPKSSRQRTSNGTRYRYDEEGNLVQKKLPTGEAWHYQWNGAGYLVGVTLPNGYTVAFTYDALGRRVSKQYRGKATRWVWDGDKLLHEWTELALGAGPQGVTDLITWLFEDNSFAPLAKLTAQGNYQSVTCDYLGTPLALHDERGQLRWAAQYTSTGLVQRGRGNAADCPFRYQGQYEDVETGLYYNRFRYYSPEEGSYLSQDPIKLAGGLNLYAYVPNPNLELDVFGLSAGHTFPTWMATRQGYQRHHIIPHSLRNHPIMQRSGMNINSASNMTYLPVAENIDPNPTRSLHRGYNEVHADYNRNMRQQLDDLDGLARRENWKPERMRKEILQLQHDTRRGLNTGRIRCH